MATFKHISSKNADYGAAEQYLTFEHDEFTMKPTLDENGQIVPRTGYLISSLNCGDEDFAIACMRSNLKYGKNQKREDVKSHHYSISFDPRDAPDNGLTVDRAQQLGEQFCKEQFPGHQALVCTHPDGHDHSGNIHVHIVINSLRIAEVPLLPYMERPADTREGCKHRCTDAAMEYFKAEVMEMCHRENLYQIDLLNGSKNRVTEREYWAKRKGQKRLFPLLVQHEELLRVMLAEKMIVRKDIDPLLEECDKQSNISAKAAVLDYAGRSLEPADPFAEMEKELAKMERQAKRFEKTGQLPASELKKIWSTKKLEDGTLEITSYKGTDTTVSVPAVIGKTAVTAIGEKALSPLASRLTPEQKRVRETLESVTIPAGVTEIGGWAFKGCANLTSVTIPEGVTEIGAWAFQGCASLTGVAIPESVTEIGSWAFTGCPKLANQQGMVIIHGILFEYMGSNRDVTIPVGVMEIGGWAFSGCANLTSVTIPAGVTEIGESAFKDCANLTNVTIPEGVKEIGAYAFRGCANLTSVTIPEGVKEIGAYAFEGCANLTSVTIPTGVTEIGKDVFKNCRPVLIAPHIPISGVAKEDKPSACAGFAQAYLDGREIDEDIKAGYLKYIKGQKKRLFPLSVQHEELLRVMLAEKMIVRKDIDPLLEECDEQSNISAKAAVLDYAGRNLKPVDPTKEFKLKGL